MTLNKKLTFKYRQCTAILELEMYNKECFMDIVSIKTTKNFRGLGYGTNVLNQIKEYSENKNITIKCNPYIKDIESDTSFIHKFLIKNGFTQNSEWYSFN